MSAAESDAPIREDLFCLECGYNLRGLSGDPVRCPECGHQNPRGMAVLPAAEITAQIRRMESTLTTAVGTVTAGLALATFAAFVVFVRRGTGMEMCLLISIVGTLAIWSVCARRFRSQCGGRVGWWSGLVRYHLFALLLIGLVIGMFAGLAIGLRTLNRGYTSGSYYMLGTLAGGVMITLLIKPVLTPLHRRLVESIEPMRREIAVSLARDYLRRKMQRGPRGR